MFPKTSAYIIFGLLLTLFTPPMQIKLMTTRANTTQELAPKQDNQELW